MTLEINNVSHKESESNLYHRFLHAAGELAKNPNHSAEFFTVAEEMTEQAMAAIRQKLERQKSESH
jgi:S-methylmethionine-dependent homocysteine/selenocysteine methylase